MSGQGVPVTFDTCGTQHLLNRRCAFSDEHDNAAKVVLDEGGDRHVVDDGGKELTQEGEVGCTLRGHEGDGEACREVKTVAGLCNFSYAHAESCVDVS